jgi:hypothetical protein
MEFLEAIIPSIVCAPARPAFAFLQDPELFNYAVLHFLGDQ